MAGWIPVSPWKITDGSGQTLTVPNAGTVVSTAVGAETRAVLLSVITGNCLVRINQTGTGGQAPTASKDVLLAPSDPPQVFGCSPGDKVSAFGLAAGTLYMAELTH